MGFISRLLGRAAPIAAAAASAAADPASPEYVPAPKAKDPKAVHPLVAAKAMRPQGKARGVGIVYDKNGRPKITEDWLKNLSAEDRRGVDINLAAHGWKLNPDNTIARA